MSERLDYLSTNCKLNTVELEQGQNPYGKIKDFTKSQINGVEFDKSSDFFSDKSKTEAFGKKYKDTLINIKQPDGKTKKIVLSGIINGGMGRNVSSRDLVQGMNDIGFGGHLSSIGIGEFYFKDNFENFGNIKGKEQKAIVNEEFDKIFIEKLGLSEELLNKHFFICNDLVEEGKEQKINTGFNGELGHEKTARKMDLIGIYKDVQKLKESGNIVGLNCMYKTSGYLSMLKISSLCGIDYVTTAAGQPDKNPKIFLQEFYSDLESENINYNIPAYGLLISMSRQLPDLDYNYYIFEDGHKAGGHIIRLKGKDKYNELDKVKEKFTKAGIKVPPIYAAGAVDSNEEFKKILDAGFDGAQIGTSAAVSKEAVNGMGLEFKERLIAGNHIGPKTENDKKYEELIDKEYEKFEGIIRIANKKILRFINNNIEEGEEKIEENNKKISILKDYILKIVYKDFNNEEVINLNEDEQKIYNLINNFLEKEFNGDIDKIEKSIRNYGNSLKFIKQFEEYISNTDSPTHLVFDSTVGFPGRTKIFEDVHKIVAGKIESSKCVNCLTDCILANRGPSKANRSSTFCIYDWLDQTDKNKQNIAFSGLSTVPYSEIRSIKDIMAYYMGYYIER